MMRVHVPLTSEDIKQLKAGMRIGIDGVLYTARDAAHEKLSLLIKEKEKLPFDPVGAVMYYTGPTPTPPGRIIGAAGPTTSYRMDPFTPDLITIGMKGFIGKGPRSAAVRQLFKQYQCVYFAAVGGAGALLSQTVKKCDVIAFEELGTEAVRRLEVRNFPVIVVNDIYGGDAYQRNVTF